MSEDSGSSDFHQPGPRQVFVVEYSDSDDSSKADESSDEEDRRELPKTGIPPEYWHIQKLVKYLKTGNQTATVVALCCLKDHDLTLEVNQLAIQDIGGLEILINLLETKDTKCKLGALNVLCELSKSPEVRRAIADMGGIGTLVQNLDDPSRELQILVSETIFNVAQIRKARKHVRKTEGIPKLVDLLDAKVECLMKPMSELTPDERVNVELSKAAARALWSTSQSLKNVKLMMTAGIVPLLARLLKSVHIEVVIPTVGIISRCAGDTNYQLALETEGMIKDIVKHLNNQNQPMLRRFCSETIFKCAESANIRDQVREAGGLDPLVSMAAATATKEDNALLAAVTGAIWKTAITPDNVRRYDQLRAVQILVSLLGNVAQTGQVLSNVVGALAECLKFPHNIENLRAAGGIPYLVNLLNYTYQPLLVNVAKVLNKACEQLDTMRIVGELDGVRLLWSLLKNPSPRVQASAALALVPCVRNAQESGEMVRCFVGGLELIVSLLRSPDVNVLANICAAISEVAKDKENLAIMTDHGVVPLLVNLIHTRNPLLQEHLASAVAFCSTWGSNCKNFGRLGAITPLVGYMSSRHESVHTTAALALYHLSENPFNCCTMHESGVVQFLLRSIATSNAPLQEAAAGCLANIRKLALEAESYQLITRGKKVEKEESDDD